MITTNPFAELSALISPETMQMYVIAMFLFVVGGTILDMVHKKSAKYFFLNSAKQKANATRSVEGQKVGLAVKTLTNEVLTSGEFSNPQRRMSHLLTMYGFIIFVITTVMMIFSLPAAADATVSTIVPMLWHLGAAMLCVGGYWFWFIIRVDVSAEAKPWYILARADMFIVSLLLTCTFALIWSATSSLWFFVFFIMASTFLFTTVLWSKFAHMFFKPAAAFQKRVARADGSNEGLPGDFDLTSAEVQAKFPDIPEYMGKNPENMGLGIKREAPRHY